MVSFESNGSANGDSGLIKMFVTKTTTAVENAKAEVKASKRIVNGQLVIVREGKMFNAVGAEL